MIWMQKILAFVMLLALPMFSAKSQVRFLDLAQELNLATPYDQSMAVSIVDLDNDFINEILTIDLGHAAIGFYHHKQDAIAYHDMIYHYFIHCWWTHNITVADVNFDHRPDLYVNDGEDGFCARLYINSMPDSFQNMTVEYGLGEADNSIGSIFFQMTPTSGLCLLSGRRLYYLQNGTFVDITPGSGLENLENVHCPVFFDIDGDYDDDLFIAGNWESNHGVLFRNNGDGTFTDISTNTDEGGFGLGQAVSFGDIDNDGDFDIYLIRGYTNNPNTMWQNDGTGFFTNITDYSNTGYQLYSRGLSFGDFDNDADLDLYISRSEGRNVLLLNNGSGVFTDYSAEAGVNSEGVGMGCAVGDLNNDGQLDIVVANVRVYQPNCVFINQNSNESYLRVKVIGIEPNTLALGAILELYGKGAPQQTGMEFIGKREISSHPMNGGVNELVVHFGTGGFSNLRLIVHFQSGAIQDTAELEPGETIIIYEPELTPINDLENLLPRQSIIVSAYPNPFNAFTKIEYSLPDEAFVTVEIYDLLGRRVETLVSEDQQAGSHQVVWDAGDRASGVYFYWIVAGEYMDMKKMILLK